MKTTLFLLVGYPGSGKTTVSRYIQELTGAAHIWADEERRKKFGDTYDRAQSSALYEDLNARTAELLKQGKSVIFDTNFNYRADRDLLRKIAEGAGAETKIIWLNTSRDLSMMRAIIHKGDTRVFKMDEQDFKRIAMRLEPPTEDEKPITFEGVNVTKQLVAEKIGL